MGREIRKVPADWQHPTDSAGHYKPMFEQYYLDALKEWIANHDLWVQGRHPDQKRYPDKASDCTFYAQWDGNPPDIDYYNLRKWTIEEATCFQVYETVTEGTPLSPVFKSLEQVEQWLIRSQGYSPREAKSFCNAGWAPSLTLYMDLDKGEMKLKDASEQKDTQKESRLPKKKTKKRGPNL